MICPMLVEFLREGAIRGKPLLLCSDRVAGRRCFATRQERAEDGGRRTETERQLQRRSNALKCSAGCWQTGKHAHTHTRTCTQRCCVPIAGWEGGPAGKVQRAAGIGFVGCRPLPAVMIFGGPDMGPVSSLWSRGNRPWQIAGRLGAKRKQLEASAKPHRKN